MIQTLDGMFAKSSSFARQAALRALMNTHMIVGSVAFELETWGHSSHFTH